ncbi:hypothetical protein [Mycobacterium sp.]|uniref:hypothetical protein n=1 Tax=Mycobacterium sp. TaxID=1785 RepID=UPI0039C9BD54
MSRPTAAVLGVAFLAAGCSGQRVVNTGEPRVHPETPAASAAPSPPPSNVHLVDAFEYVAHVNGSAGYYFTTPSGKWRCAIFPRAKAGCQSANSWASGLGVDGEPDAVNAIVVEREGDPRFVSLEQPEFALDPGPANTLPFNRILAAAGFRCNVQESGVSCLSEFTSKGFTFSAEGYTLQYTDVPPAAP